MKSWSKGYNVEESLMFTRNLKTTSITATQKRGQQCKIKLDGRSHMCFTDVKGFLGLSKALAQILFKV